MTEWQKSPRPYRLGTTLKAHLMQDGQRIAGLVRNLSRTGAYVRTPQPLALHQKLELELLVSGESYLIPVEVARLDHDGAGLKFELVPKDAEFAIAHLVAKGRDMLEAVEFVESGGDLVTVAIPRSADRAGGPRPRPARPAPPPAPPRWRGLRIALAASGIAAGSLLAVVLIGGPWSPREETASIERPARADRARVEVHLLSADPVAEAAPAPEATPAPLIDPRLGPLLAEAKTRFAAGSWSMPRGESALDSYRAALAIDPGNSDAQAGVIAIVEGYAQRSAERRAEGDAFGARWRIERAIEILEKDAAGQVLPDRATRVASLRQTR